MAEAKLLGPRATCIMASFNCLCGSFCVWSTRCVILELRCDWPEMITNATATRANRANRPKTKSKSTPRRLDDNPAFISCALYLILAKPQSRKAVLKIKIKICLLKWIFECEVSNHHLSVQFGDILLLCAFARNCLFIVLSTADPNRVPWWCYKRRSRPEPRPARPTGCNPNPDR